MSSPTADQPVAGPPVRPSRWRRWLRILFSPAARISALVLIVGGIFLGVGGVLTAGAALQFTSSNAFCMSCHEENIVPLWEQSVHFANATGVVVGCADCHEPHDFIGLMIRKVESLNEVWNQLIGTISTPAKFQAHQGELAQSVWDDFHKTDSAQCRNCHQLSSMVDAEKPDIRDMHIAAETGGLTCIDCHQGVGHQMPSVASK